MLGATLAADPRRVALIASRDWAQAHASAIGAGHPAAIEIDRLVTDAVARGALADLAQLDAGAVADAAVDGLWQALGHAGALAVVPMTVELLGYEAPARYATGMIVACTPR